MAKDITFGQPFRRSKNGNYKMSATIPIEDREACFGRGSKQKQKELSLETNNLHEAISRIPRVKADIIKWYREKVNVHDPLVMSAEKLIESLFAKYEYNNKVKPQSE